ncbi:MAG: nucleotide exchange factor GrpE [Holosporaceae bacterium]|jgi:molecular chaperone GrpE|nr:nucleotide exchange factor GrpE [Holosporaceae bacterium]
MNEKDENLEHQENIAKPEGAISNPENKISEIDKIAQLEEEVKILKDTLLRKAAELENLRKRVERELEDALKYSNAKFAKDLLVVEDNFERVLENSLLIREKPDADANLKALLDGILLCKKELVAVFKKHGISKVEIAEGDKFDPQYHQAMCEVDNANCEDGTIINTFQAGYLHNERLLRPAMVSVVSRKT